MEPISVALIDDDEIIRKGLRETIPWNSLGFTVVAEANNGKGGIEAVGKMNPRLVILDIKMPGMDGLEVSKIIRQKFPHTKVMLLSGYSDFEYARIAIKEGVIEYILKPIYLPDFIEILKKIRTRIIEEDEKREQEIILEYKASAGESAVIDELILRIINDENRSEAWEKLGLMGFSAKHEIPAIALMDMDIRKEKKRSEYRKQLQGLQVHTALFFRCRSREWVYCFHGKTVLL